MPTEIIPRDKVYAHIVRNSISKEEAERTRPASLAKNNYEVSLVFLRMLEGEPRWTDGYERQLDNCLENGKENNDQVVEQVLVFAKADPRIEALLEHHDSMSGNTLATWKEMHPNPVGCEPDSPVIEEIAPPVTEAPQTRTPSVTP